MRDYPYGHTTIWLGAVLLTCGAVAVGAWASDDGGARKQLIAGPARVVDGDTVVVGGVRVRLEGIDAPEASQTCARPPGETWPCGTESTHALAVLIAGRELECDPRGTDKYGRVLAVCFLDRQDINAWMVRQGHAWAFTRYSTSYVNEEAEARARRLGIWQGGATPAWEYRAQRWARAEPLAPQGCAIKGNVTANGKIYHMPWSPWYAQIKMDTGRGRRWFCTEAEALAAGWRPVNVH
jgi:endonuclease YncB( thermonuclease family)